MYRIQRYISLSIIYLLVIWIFPSQAQEIHIAHNIQVSKSWSEFPHAEAHLAVNQDNPLEMVAASMVYKEAKGRDYAAVYYSSDGGRTWKPSDFPKEPKGTVDPWVIFNKGTAYYSYLPGYIHKSRDGGKSWSTEKAVFKNPKNSLDFLKIVASKNTGDVFAVATNHLKIEDGVYIDPISIFKIDTDLEESHKTVDLQPTMLNLKNGTPVVWKKKLVVPYYELLDMVNRNILEYNRIWITQIDIETQNVSPAYWTGLTGGAINMCINPVFNNRLHLLSYTRAGEGFKLLYSHSDDGGKTWTKGILIEDFERHPQSTPTNASITVSDDGVVGILWADHRTDPTNNKYGMYFMYSVDGGKTFSQSHLISEISSPKTDKNMNTFIGNSGRSVADRFWVGGDYYGLQSTGKKSFQALWVDSRTGVAQIWTTKIRIVND